MLNSDTPSGAKVRYTGPSTEKWDRGDVFTLTRFHIVRHGWAIELENVKGRFDPRDFENIGDGNEHG
jgi:hypothetical protein